MIFLIRFYTIAGLLTLMSYCVNGQDIAVSNSFKVHLDMRRSVIDNKVLKMWGGSVGWEISEMQHEATLGYYWLGNRGRGKINDILLNRSLRVGMSRYNSLDLKFISGGFWYTLWNERRWKVALPVESGLGWATMKDIEFANDYVTGEHQFQVYPTQAAVYGEWKATRWLGVGGHAGYRHFFVSKQHNLPEVNGLYYRMRVLIYFNTIQRDARNAIFKKQPLKSPFY